MPRMPLARISPIMLTTLSTPSGSGVNGGPGARSCGCVCFVCVRVYANTCTGVISMFSQVCVSVHAWIRGLGGSGSGLCECVGVGG